MRDYNEKWWVRLLKGTTLGLGMIPGVSAGTMGLVFNFYDLLINSIANLRKEFKKSFMTLLPMGIGAVISILAVTIFVHYGYSAAPLAITCLFAGFTLGTTPIIKAQIDSDKIDRKSWLLFFISMSFVILIGIFSCISKIFWRIDMSAFFINGDWWIYPIAALAGFIAAAACILPGISGAMILFIFGMYTPIIDLFLGDNSMFHNTSRVGVGLGVIVCLLIGILAGFILTSKGMKYLLANHHQGTMVCIMGFIIGSIFVMFLNQELVDVNPETGIVTWVYQTTPTWEWIVAPIVLVAVTAGVLFLSLRATKKSLD